jgi:DegV family protein with EDD domain
MSVRIIVDSASDLTKERADALNLDYMPLKTIFGETEYLDGVTISHKEFYEKLIECGTIPTTSQVSPHDFEAKFKEVKEAGDTAVVICLSSLLSGTYQSAHIALDGYEDCIRDFALKNKSPCSACEFQAKQGISILGIKLLFFSV